MTELEYRILGPLEVRRYDEPLDLGGLKPRTVLGALLVEANRVVADDRLIDAVWGDASSDGAANTLYVYIAKLRALLEPDRLPRAPATVLLTQPPGYLLRVETDRLDALRFEALVKAGRAALSRGEHAMASKSLAQALSLWRGPVLADLGDIPFAVAAARHFEGVRRGAQQDRVDADLALGRHDAILAELDHLVTEEPANERAIGQLMLALYRCGRQSEALDLFARARDALLETRGLSPSPELRRLEFNILQHSSDLDLPPAPQLVAVRRGRELPLPPDVLAARSASVVVGRSEQLAGLHEAVEDWDGGSAALVLLSGEPGVGKTRLAAEFAAEMHRGDMSVLCGRCDEDPYRPYQPFAQALLPLVEASTPADLSPPIRHFASQLGRLWPELGWELADVAAPDTERLLLFEGIVSLLIQLGPALLVIDDLHWVDADTAALLNHLVARSNTPILVIGTCRDIETADNESLTGALSDIRRARPAGRLRLTGLDPDEVAAFVKQHPALGDDPTLARELWDKTEGNPLFLWEVVRDWTAHAGQSVRASVPDDVASLVRRRLKRLPEIAQRLLVTASVIGREVRLDVLEAVLSLDENTFLDALDEVRHAGLLVEASSEGDWLRFSHQLIRDALYGELSAARRHRTHHRVGEAMEQLSGLTDPPRSRELAFHFDRGRSLGDAEKAFAHARAAGDEAVAQLAYQEASELYTMALAALDRGRVESQRDTRLLLQYRVVLALARAGATDRAEEQLESFGLARSLEATASVELREDVAALRARLAKDRALDATGNGRRSLAREAAKRYEAIYDQLGRPYSGINAATMWLVAGEKERAIELAGAVRGLCRTTAAASSEEAYWLAATEAEAALLLGRVGDAARALARAAAEPGANLAARTTTRAQLELVCEQAGLDPQPLDALGPRSAPW